MLGYRAEWKSGDIQIDGEEIVDAQWFSIDRLPKLPPKASISRGMIDAYVSERLS
jgi:NAD+ diphosphatase